MTGEISRASFGLAGELFFLLFQLSFSASATSAASSSGGEEKGATMTRAHMPPSARRGHARAPRACAREALQPRAHSAPLSAPPSRTPLPTLRRRAAATTVRRDTRWRSRASVSVVRPSRATLLPWRLGVLWAHQRSCGLDFHTLQLRTKSRKTKNH